MQPVYIDSARVLSAFLDSMQAPDVQRVLRAAASGAGEVDADVLEFYAQRPRKFIDDVKLSADTYMRYTNLVHSDDIFAHGLVNV